MVPCNTVDDGCALMCNTAWQQNNIYAPSYVYAVDHCAVFNFLTLKFPDISPALEYAVALIGQPPCEIVFWGLLLPAGHGNIGIRRREATRRKLEENAAKVEVLRKEKERLKLSRNKTLSTS